MGVGRFGPEAADGEFFAGRVAGEDHDQRQVQPLGRQPARERELVRKDDVGREGLDHGKDRADDAGRLAQKDERQRGGKVSAALDGAVRRDGGHRRKRRARLRHDGAVALRGKIDDARSTANERANHRQRGEHMAGRADGNIDSLHSLAILSGLNGQKFRNTCLYSKGQNRKSQQNLCVNCAKLCGGAEGIAQKHTKTMPEAALRGDKNPPDASGG